MSKAALAMIQIVLVEPAGPLNLGAIARIMKNTGFHHLILVSPRCDLQDPQARQMAVHAQSVLESAVIVNSLPEALAGCQRAIATTARRRAETRQAELPETALPWLLVGPPKDSIVSASAAVRSALVFGPEDRGLSNAELNCAQRTVTVPTSPDYPSLNLAQAVGICCYLLRRASLELNGTGWLDDRAETPNLATLDQIEEFLAKLEQLLLQVGYLYPHTAHSRMEKFRRLLHRSAPDGQELAMLRGILRQVDWALKANSRQS